MFNNVYKIVYFVLLLLAFSLRAYFSVKYRKKDLSVDNKSILDSIFLFISALGMTIPLLYIFTTILDFANYRLAIYWPWLDGVFFLLFAFLLWRSHEDLGENWTPTLAIVEDQKFVSEGIFKYIRHPMYAAHWVLGIVQALVLPNYIAGFALLLSIVPLYIYRVPKEEKMLKKVFGKKYDDYIKRTGRIFPNLF